MILSVSMQQTTLYDQIRYTGSPDSFAWVLPIAGTAEVGLSADVVFGALDTMTRTTIYAPPRNCAPAPYCKNFGPDASAFGAADSSAGGVDVLKSEVVGPYETVQLASTDPAALANWLTSHGYDIPADIQPVIDAYVQAGLDFLAMKLVPGASVQSMRPVRVTTKGASPVLPLRMVAAGTGSSVGITLWVVSDGRYEPQNFPSFRIQDSEIVWDYSTQSSNYASLRQAYEQQSGNQAWELESALPVYVDGFKSVVDNGGLPYPQFNYDAGSDYQPVGDPDAGDGGGGMTAAQVRDADLAALFAGTTASTVTVTRMRADLGRSALGRDLVLQASADQKMLTNLRYPTKSINAPVCPTYPPCPPNGSGDVTASGGGCAVSPGDDGGNGFLLLVAGLAIVGAHSVARRRKR
jgi:MYXO-CTERM domain-containing protein